MTRGLSKDKKIINRQSTKSRCSQCWHCCLTISAFLFSHIGLCTLVFGYSILGAFSFRALEAENELKYRQIMINVRDDVVERLWKLTENSSVLVQTNWTNSAMNELINFELSLIQAVKFEGYDGKDDTDPKTLQWNFFGALLYSIIVITTIGYGNIAPKTKYGKVATIVYAIFGIPLMLICLSNIGDTLAHSFKFLYWKVCCVLCAKPRRRRHRRKYSRRKRHKKNQIEQIAMQTFQATNTLQATNTFQNQLPSRYSSTQNHYSLDTRRSSRASIICNKYALQRETLDDLAVPPEYSANYPARPYATLPPKFTLTSPTGNSTTAIPMSSGVISSQPLSRSLNSFEYSSEEDSDSIDSESGNNEIPNVPITLCIALVVSYICGGALLFKFWESWTFLDSCYFCFVTLTTIGFGDLVPGTAVFSRDDAQTILGICAFYLLFGMALLAMSFNLVKEEVTKSVRSIGKRIGILSKDDSDSESD